MNYTDYLHHPIKALRHSFSGLKAIFHGETSFRLELFLTIILLPLALSFTITCTEKVILIGSWFLVLIVEALNSAIEILVDRISLEIHPLSKKAKDVGSAAVFLALVNAVTIWTIVLIANYWFF